MTTNTLKQHLSKLQSTERSHKLCWKRLQRLWLFIRSLSVRYESWKIWCLLCPHQNRTFTTHSAHSKRRICKIDDSLLYQDFDLCEQEAFMQELNAYMQVDPTKCYMGTTEHPFTDFFSANEARITTHYYKDNVLSAIFSTNSWIWSCLIQSAGWWSIYRYRL